MVVVWSGRSGGKLIVEDLVGATRDDRIGELWVAKSLAVYHRKYELKTVVQASIFPFRLKSNFMASYTRT